MPGKSALHKAWTSCYQTHVSLSLYRTLKAFIKNWLCICFITKTVKLKKHDLLVAIMGGSQWVFRICNRPLSNCVRTKEQSWGWEDKFAFFIVCTKEIANLYSQPRLCSFVCAKLKSGLLDLFEVQDSRFEGSQMSLQLDFERDHHD